MTLDVRHNGIGRLSLRYLLDSPTALVLVGDSSRHAVPLHSGQLVQGINPDTPGRILVRPTGHVGGRVIGVAEKASCRFILSATTEAMLGM
jgi:hypothetical protein